MLQRPVLHHSMWRVKTSVTDPSFYKYRTCVPRHKWSWLKWDNVCTAICIVPEKYWLKCNECTGSNESLTMSSFSVPQLWMNKFSELLSDMLLVIVGVGCYLMVLFCAWADKGGHWKAGRQTGICQQHTERGLELLAEEHEVWPERSLYPNGREECGILWEGEQWPVRKVHSERGFVLDGYWDRGGRRLINHWFIDFLGNCGAD